MIRHLLYALAWLLESAPFASYHSLHARGSDLYHVARYGRGRNHGAWFYGWPHITKRFDWHDDDWAPPVVYRRRP